MMDPCRKRTKTEAEKVIESRQIILALKQLGITLNHDAGGESPKMSNGVLNQGVESQEHGEVADKSPQLNEVGIAQVSPIEWLRDVVLLRGETSTSVSSRKKRITSQPVENDQQLAVLDLAQIEIGQQGVMETGIDEVSDTIQLLLCFGGINKELRCATFTPGQP